MFFSWLVLATVFWVYENQVWRKYRCQGGCKCGGEVWCRMFCLHFHFCVVFITLKGTSVDTSNDNSNRTEP